MTERPFRFGLVGGPTDVQQWRGLVRRADELGYDTLLTPDNLHMPAPTVSLGLAAGISERLRVGTYVFASPLRTPRAAAWDAHSLSVLTGRRFECGLGTGIPAMREQAAEVGLPYGTGPQRLEQVAETVRHLRELDGDEHTPVMIAAGGPKARALAGRTADIVALAAPALASRDEVRVAADEVRAAAADRADGVELTMNIFVVGDEMQPWTEQFVGANMAELVAHDSLTLLRGTPTEMADELRRRRDDFGVSYVTVNADNTERFAPVLELLHGA